MSTSRFFKVQSFVVDDQDISQNPGEVSIRAMAPAGAARKAASRLLKLSRPGLPQERVAGVIDIAEIGPNEAKKKMYGYRVERTYVRKDVAFNAHFNTHFNFHNAPPVVIPFNYTMNICAVKIPQSDRCSWWLKRYPENTKLTWQKRPK